MKCNVTLYRYNGEQLETYEKVWVSHGWGKIDIYVEKDGKWLATYQGPFMVKPSFDA
jgi:hypothetical protein